MRTLSAVAPLLLMATWARAAPAGRPPVPVAVPIAATAAPGAEQAPAAPVPCTLGFSGPRSFLLDYIQPPDDSFLIVIDPAACGGCAGAPGVWISSVKITLEFRVPCSLPVEVAVVTPAADSACAAPRPAIPVGGPWPGTVTATTAGIHDFTLSLGHPCAITRRAFLQVRFTGTAAACNSDTTRPRLVTNATCAPCKAWNIDSAGTTDLCSLLLPGVPLIWANVDSCVSASLAGVPPPRAGAGALGASPNPARGATDISFSLAAAARVQVVLHDVSGRRVRELLDAALGQGAHALRWDGRDSRGRPVPAGTYFVVVRSGGRTSARSVVFVR